MKVIGVSIIPTTAATNAGRPQLTPELLAAVGAKYSRSNDGLTAILESIDRSTDPDRMVERIFEFVDFGHQSIADGVPVAMFIDGLSEILAYLIWAATPVQTAAGQESSTRYIRLSMDGIIDPGLLGIPEQFVETWNCQNAQAFEAYETAIIAWENILTSNPGLAKIPSDILNDPSKEKQVARMMRNFAFDRARVYLPVGVATNMFLLMSARSWVGLCQYLLSSPLLESNVLGRQIVEELELFTPRMMKHATAKESTRLGLRDELNEATAAARLDNLDGEKEPKPYLDVMLPRGVSGQDLASSLQHHENRYAWIGHPLRRTSVRFGWEAVGLAEIRDFNRHRTGTKYCPIVPVGFHGAVDQCPEENVIRQDLSTLCAVGQKSTNSAIEHLSRNDPSYVYWLLLGSQLPFEHTTTGDKFVYEMELRTGTGAHYRYARHCRELLSLWYEKFPETEGRIIEGAAEPE